MRSAVIIAGGKGSRLGDEKSLIEFDGKPLIQWSVQKLMSTADEVIVVSRDEAQAEFLSKLLPTARFVCDRISGYGPVAGLAVGMRSAKGKYALAVGVDLPFLNTSVLEKIFLLAEGYDAAIPIHQNGCIEPLHAVYEAKKMNDACERAIVAGHRRISAPIGDLKTNFIPEGDLRPIDPQLLSFFNINTKEDLVEARMLWKLGGPGRFSN